MRVVELEPRGEGRWMARVDDTALEITAEVLSSGALRLVTPDRTVVAVVSASGERRFVALDGMDFVLEREAGGRRRSPGAAGSLEAPMPGLVTRVMVAAGEAVRQGQPLLALEAMKMEHVLRAPRDGRVKRVAAQAGEMVSGGLELVELEEA